MSHFFSFLIHEILIFSWSFHIFLDTDDEYFDNLKVFPFYSAETYPAHTKCVSEEEKYSAKGFVPRPSAQKGEYKQKKWQDIVQSLHKNQSSLSHDEQIIINAISKRENVPRKKSKFQVIWNLLYTMR
jgi:hypothetical protein